MPLHVTQVSFYTDPAERDPRQLLEAWPTVAAVAECAAKAGARVSVVQASQHHACLRRGAIEYHFLPCMRADQSTVRAAQFGELLRRLAPDVLHVQSLGFPHDVTTLAALAPGIPILLQDHADRVPRFWRRGPWRRAAAAVAGAAFCAQEQAFPFVSAGLLGAHTRIFQIPESSSDFTPGSREQARVLSKLHGDPLVLWVGHLNQNKDPLTVLAGISAAVPALPGLQAWFCYGSAPLREQVSARIAQDPLLRGRVHLLGRVEHERIELLMRAADLFVLGSHREGSGYSLMEALACGVSPVVTDIPSFRAMTCGGAVGRLWKCGDAEALCAALVQLGKNACAGRRAAVREHFDRELSFTAVGAKLVAAYRELRDLHGHSAGVAEPAVLDN